MDGEACKDCRAYRDQYSAFLTYYGNIFTLADRDRHWSGLSKPPTKPRKPHLVNGKPTPGDRCTTHWRAKRTRDRAASHARRVKSGFNLQDGEYDSLKEYQDGLCAICRRNKGISRRLAVDHDHKCCPGKTSCGECVRGLLCSPCNSMLAHARDDPAMFLRAQQYLKIPPAFLWKIDKKRGETE